jgi:2,3-dihydroxybiphenyl 1,2-dioxygenase
VAEVAVTELGYVGLGVSDLSRWRVFAGEVLGMECVEAGENLHLRMDYWNCRIRLHVDASDDLLYAGFRVAGPEEFLGMQRKLTHLGTPFEVGSWADANSRGVLELLRLEDPAGIPIEVFHGPRVDYHAPMLPSRGMHGRFATGAGGMGHMVVRDGGVDASYRFYTEVLGLRGSVESRVQVGDDGVEITFLHCNERDHTVAFGMGPMKKRLHHLMIEVENLDDVGLAYDLVQKRELPVLLNLGKHANDQMLSFYVQTPSGWFCEYGGGGRAASEQSEYSVRGIWGHDLVARSLLG